MSETELAEQLGPVVATYGWSLESRATAFLLSLISLASGVAWFAWERHEYGDISAGGGIVTAAGIAIGAAIFAVGASSLGERALVLHEHGFVSYLHRRDTVCFYRDIGLIQRFRKGNLEFVASLFLLHLQDGRTIRIHSVRNLRGAIRVIQERSGTRIERPS